MHHARVIEPGEPGSKFTDALLPLFLLITGLVISVAYWPIGGLALPVFIAFGYWYVDDQVTRIVDIHDRMVIFQRLFGTVAIPISGIEKITLSVPFGRLDEASLRFTVTGRWRELICSWSNDLTDVVRTVAATNPDVVINGMDWLEEPIVTR